MRSRALPFVAVALVAIPVACSADEGDFKSEAESYIEGDFSDDLEDEGLDRIEFTDAECEEPADTDVGTAYSCTAQADSGETYEFEIEITDDDALTVQDFGPAGG